MRNYVDHMIDAAQRIGRFIGNVSREQFIANELLQDVVIRNLEVIGEAARNAVLAQADLPQRFPQIAWSAAQGMRHRLSHGYFSIDLDIVWTTIERDVPQLLAELKRVRAELTS